MPLRIQEGLGPFRSVLFLPLSKPDRVGKAAAAGADWICLDLEDGVAPNLKKQARADLADALDACPTHQKVAVRINALRDDDRDLPALAALKKTPDALFVPKVEGPGDLVEVTAKLGELGAKPPPLIPILETPLGVASGREIALAPVALAAMAFGFADYTAQTGGASTATALLTPRALVVNAAAIAGVPALDGVCLQLDDDSALNAEAAAALELGFSGKIVIHPRQTDTVNHVFTPSDKDLEWARAVLAAVGASDGVEVVEGAMVDAALEARATRILAAAQNEEGGG